MDKLSFLTGYQSGLDNAANKMHEKTAVIVPENKQYGVAPEAVQSYQYEKQQKNQQKQNLAKILGITIGVISGGLVGAGALRGGRAAAKAAAKAAPVVAKAALRFGKAKAALGAIAGGTIGGGVAQGLTDEGVIGADMDQGRPVADVVRDLKLRKQGPGSSYEEKYMKPFKRSEIK